MDKKFELNDLQKEAVEMLKDTIINIAYENEDFYCSTCLDTIDRLLEILSSFTNDNHRDLQEEVYNIIGK